MKVIPTLNHASLFSGIGGFDYAAQQVGWTNIFHCEINKYNQKILKNHFPETISYEDIKQTNFIIHRGEIDVLTGGFPCQPFSIAGKQKGKADDRYLWNEMYRAICEIQPSWVVGENVYGIINLSGGLVFDEVHANLETEGYEVITFVLPACGVNAPHKRNRVWFIAYNKGFNDRKYNGKTKARQIQQSGKCPKQDITANSISIGNGGFKMQQCGDIAEYEILQEEHQRRKMGCETKGCNRKSIISNPCGNENPWRDFPTQSPVCGRDDGLPNRVDRLKALGNAIVPQVALQIFKAINQYNDGK